MSVETYEGGDAQVARVAWHSYMLEIFRKVGIEAPPTFNITCQPHKRHGCAECALTVARTFLSLHAEQNALIADAMLEAEQRRFGPVKLDAAAIREESEAETTVLAALRRTPDKWLAAACATLGANSEGLSLQMALVMYARAREKQEGAQP